MHFPLNRPYPGADFALVEEIGAIKMALYLRDWSQGDCVTEVEGRYGVSEGEILAAAAHVRVLIEATASLAVAMGTGREFVEQVRRVGQRVLLGGRREAERAADLTVPPLVEPVLDVDDHHPCEIRLDGVRIRLQEKQYRLMCLLAEQPGTCVGYEEIYNFLWGGVIVESNQMHFQKRRLVEAITAQIPERRNLIRTIPKRGFVLELGCSEVRRVSLGRLPEN